MVWGRRGVAEAVGSSAGQRSAQGIYSVGFSDRTWPNASKGGWRRCTNMCSMWTVSLVDTEEMLPSQRARKQTFFLLLVDYGKIFFFLLLYLLWLTALQLVESDVISPWEAACSRGILAAVQLRITPHTRLPCTVRAWPSRTTNSLCSFLICCVLV